MTGRGLVRIFSHELIDPERPDHKEPCLNICRRTLGGQGKRVVIPLANLYQYWENADLAAKAVEFTGVLFDGCFGKGDLLAVGNCIDDGLDELFKMKPDMGPSKLDIENEMHRLGLKFSVDGRTVVDAS
ncbi:MAG: hypothetical protein Q8N34_03250 [Gammaproteobacteria bacterium]|nr:hypothetical protein [Gammaproteobacteria bacterium]